VKATDNYIFLIQTHNMVLHVSRLSELKLISHLISKINNFYSTQGQV